MKTFIAELVFWFWLAMAVLMILGAADIFVLIAAIALLGGLAALGLAELWERT
jgi:hypothetical protein